MATAYDLKTETHAGTGLLASDHVITDGVMIKADETNPGDSSRGSKLPQGTPLAPISGDANDRYGAVRRTTFSSQATVSSSGAISLAHTSQVYQFTVGDTVAIYTAQHAGSANTGITNGTIYEIQSDATLIVDFAAGSSTMPPTGFVEVVDTGHNQTACILMDEVDLYDDDAEEAVDTPARVLRHGMVQTEGISMPYNSVAGGLDDQTKYDMEPLITFV